MEVTINGLKIQIEGASDAQVFFDQETNTVKVQVKQKVVEKIKIVEVKGKNKVQFVPVPPVAVPVPPVAVPVPVQPIPWKPYFPWNKWERWTLCEPNQIIGTTTGTNTPATSGFITTTTTK
jgi:hypothetical protein